MNESKNDQKPLIPGQTPGAKVLNFSPQKKSSQGFFRKKSFLIGLILTIILGLGAIFTGYYFIQQRITTPPQAAGITNPEECKGSVSFVKGSIVTSNSDPTTNIASVSGKVRNKCKKDVTLYMNAYWCSEVKEPLHTCSDNKRKPTATVVIPAGKTKKFSIEQKIGDNGTCGSAQVDVFFVKGGSKSGWPIANGGAWGEKKPCDEQPECISLDKSVTGNLQVKAGMNFKYGKFVTDYQFNWGDGLYSTVSASKDPALNSASHTYAKYGTYEIQGGAIVNDTKFYTSEACKASVTFTEVTKYYFCNADNKCTQNACPAGETCTSTCDPAKPNPCGSKFNECVGETCTQSDCPPGETCTNKCSLTDPNACKTPTKYHVCSSQNACEEKTCPVGQTCTSTCDPSKANPCGSTFSQCSGEACVSVKCPVGTTCQSTCDITKANSCKTFKHNVCQNSACVQKDCPNKGIDCALSSDCQSDASCVVVRTYQHSVCVNQSCVRVDCSPNTQPCGNECTSNSNCRTATVTPPVAVVQTHKECVNQACVVVNGAGANQCTSDVSCRPVATPPAIPKSGSLELTIMGVVLGVGAVAAGLLLAL